MKQMIQLTNEQRIILKNTQLELLDEFKSFCDNHNLRFYLFGGTLLGAIRHNGFIPWDDDIDVCMPREDYNLFLKLYKESDRYFLQTTKTDNHYFYHFAKLMKKNTIYNEYFTQNLKTQKGIFIDIFPINGYPDKKISKFHYNFWLFLLNKKSYPLNVYKIRKIKRSFSYIAMTILSWLLFWWAPYLIFGYGKTASSYFLNVSSNFITHTFHNGILDILCSFGIFGVALYFYGIRHSYKETTLNAKQGIHKTLIVAIIVTTLLYGLMENVYLLISSSSTMLVSNVILSVSNEDGICKIEQGENNYVEISI